MIDNKKTEKMRDSGFTLLEIMVAISILAFALVSLLSAVNHNVELTQRARNAEVAANLASNIISRIEVEGIPEVREDSGTFEDHPGFEWNLSILPYNLSQLEAQINIINVLISWEEGEESYEINLAVEG